MKTFGLDMSHYQGLPDFESLKNEFGVTFVILKCGGSDDGLYKEYTFDEQYKRAKAVGLNVGAFYYSSARSIAEAQVDADNCAFCLKGKQLEYPIFLDLEELSQQSIGKSALNSVVKTFCNSMENKGYWCGFYTNLDWYKNYLDGPSLAERYSFWFANWGTEMAPLPNVQMWQKGSSYFNGLEIDIDYCFVDYPAMIKAKGKNGFAPTKPQESTIKPTPEKPKDNTEIKRGDTIMLTPDAIVYGSNGLKFYDYVYNLKYKVMNINNNVVMFGPNVEGAVTGLVDKKFVKKV